MRLQGAIFDGTDLLCDGAGKPRPGVSEFLALLKMEGVWLYLVTAGERAEAERVLSRAGLGERFRGVLSAGEVRGGIEDVYERAVRRLQTAKPTVVVFTADLERLAVLYAADFRLAAVAGDQAVAEETRKMTEYCIRDFAELICRS